MGGNMEDTTKTVKMRRKSPFWLHFFLGLLLLNGIDFLLNGFLPGLHNYVNMNNLNNAIQGGYGLIAGMVNYNPKQLKLPKIKRDVLPESYKYNTKKKYELPKNLPPETLSQMRQSLIKTAESYLNTPYKHGGTKPSAGFDCSGFIFYIYNKVGIKLPRAMGKQIAMGKLITYAHLKPGDLIFFRGNGAFNSFSHVAIYKGMDSKGTMWVIHANHTGGKVTYQRLNLLPRIRIYKSYL